MQIYYSPLHALHATDQISVDGQAFLTEEVPQRAQILYEACQNAYGSTSEPTNFGLQPILAVHDADYVEFLSTIYSQTKDYFKADTPVFPGTFARGPVRRKSAHVESLPGYFSYATWSPIVKGTWQAAYWSAQCALSAVDSIFKSPDFAYAICRPPGHHAFPALYGGFCYLNNAAIAARYLQAVASQSQSPSVEETARVAVLDLDYHHGNGTQEIFYSDPTVFFCSLHAHPDEDYPYFWGAAEETGSGPGTGYNLNIPLPAGCEDKQYLAALEQALAVIQRFSPRYLVISLGLDTGKGDPVGGFNLTTTGFKHIGELIASARLPTATLQEGGYQLEQMAEWLLSFLSAFD